MIYFQQLYLHRCTLFQTIHVLADHCLRPVLRVFMLDKFNTQSPEWYYDFLNVSVASALVTSIYFI